MKKFATAFADAALLLAAPVTMALAATCAIVPSTPAKAQPATDDATALDPAFLEKLRVALREHPELTPAEYAMAQLAVDEATHRVRDTPRSMVFIRDADDGHLVVVKATSSGQGLFLTSFRRMSGDPFLRAQVIRRLLKRG